MTVNELELAALEIKKLIKEAWLKCVLTEAPVYRPKIDVEAIGGETRGKDARGTNSTLFSFLKISETWSAKSSKEHSKENKWLCKAESSGRAEITEEILAPENKLLPKDTKETMQDAKLSEEELSNMICIYNLPPKVAEWEIGTVFFAYNLASQRQCSTEVTFLTIFENLGVNASGAPHFKAE
ncbi:hypothetical protein G9A89_005434 [Geosiphon pyriformis]|nr:hypothetical protein G9A89_005434 [Geosiphon pyriformis]